MPLSIRGQSNASIVGFQNTEQSHQTQKAQRREVKAIATSLASDLLNYKNRYNRELTPGCLDAFAEHFSQKRETLSALRNAPLSTAAPANSIARQARSVASLGTGVMSRGAALTGASVVGAAHCAAVTPLVPLLTTGLQAVVSAVEGASRSPCCLAPIGAAIGLGAGATLGLARGVAAMPGTAYVVLTSRGTVTKRLFRKWDSLSSARLHVAHKKMSTHAIAAAADAKIAEVLADIQHKKSVGMRYRSLGFGVRTEYFPKSRVA